MIKKITKKKSHPLGQNIGSHHLPRYTRYRVIAGRVIKGGDCIIYLFIYKFLELRIVVISTYVGRPFVPESEMSCTVFMSHERVRFSGDAEIVNVHSYRVWSRSERVNRQCHS